MYLRHWLAIAKVREWPQLVTNCWKESSILWCSKRLGHLNDFIIYYRPQTKLRKVNVFTGVSLSVILSREGELGTSVADPRFSRGGAPTPKLRLFYNFLAKNCMKLKEFGPGGRVPGAPSLYPPLHIMQHAIGYMVGYPLGHQTYPLPIPAEHQTWGLTSQLMTSSSHHWRFVQTSSLEDPPPPPPVLTSGGSHWNT